MRHVAHRIQFRGYLCNVPLFPQIVKHLLQTVCAAAMRHPHAELSLKNLLWAKETASRHAQSVYRAVAAPSGMDLFCPCSILQELLQSRGLAPADTKGVGKHVD